MKNLKFANQKSVSFNVKNFCVPSKRKKQSKHTVYAVKNIGFCATEKSLINGYIHEPFGMAVSLGSGEPVEQKYLSDFDESVIKNIFCFCTHQNGKAVNMLLAVTENDIYYVPLTGSMTARRLIADVVNFNCFAYSFSKDTDYIFAANDDGIFVADKVLAFAPLDVGFKAKQMQVFENRLFVLDTDSETLHFSTALDLCDFSAKTGLAGSIKTDDSLGKILSIENFNGKLLLVHEYGFRTLESAYNPEKFKLKILAYCYENIVPNSAKALGDTIYFLTRAGICRYTDVVELLDIEINAVPEAAQSIIYDNKYFLSANGRLYTIEKFFDSVTIYENMNIRAFERVWNPYSDCLAVLTEDSPNLVLQVSKAMGSAKEMFWESDWFSLGYATIKQYIRRVLVKTSGSIDLVVMNTRSSRKIKIKGSSEIQAINLNFKGDAFKVKIVANGGDNQVSDLSIAVGF